jgi:hypothetical protein
LGRLPASIRAQVTGAALVSWSKGDASASYAARTRSSLTIDFFGKTPAQHSQDGRFFGLKSGKLISQLVLDRLFYFQNELAIQIRC